MRPVGSRTGRTPPGGYPTVAPPLGGFLAGFIEGEGSFVIARQTRGYGYRCGMSLSVRDDDANLVRDLAEKTRLGTLVRVEGRAGSRPQVRWSVVAKSDCRRLVEVLYAYPLRGRKAAVFAIWAAAVNWWIGLDATRQRPPREWGPLPYLKERLTSVKLYDREGYACADSGPDGLSSDWADYLAGFVTADGYLGMSKTPSGCLAPRMTVRVRADDRPLLEQLQHRLAAGHVTGPYTEPGKSPVVSWTVTSRADLGRLLALFNEHPPRGRKAAQFQLWREAVLIHLGGPARDEEVRARMAALQRALKRARLYAGRDSE